MEEIKEQNILSTESAETVKKSCCGHCGKKINCWKGVFLAALLFLAVSLVYVGYQFSQKQTLPSFVKSVTECRNDSDCGINICDCKAEPRKNLTPKKLMCTRICDGVAKCIDTKCILVK